MFGPDFKKHMEKSVAELLKATPAQEKAPLRQKNIAKGDDNVIPFSAVRKVEVR